MLNGYLLCMGVGASTESFLWVFPSVQRSLHIASSTMGAIFSAQLAGAFIGALVLTCVEHFGGRKQLLCVFISIALCGIALQSTAGSVETLAIGRFVAGFGAGSVNPVGMAHLAEFLPLANRGRLLSFPQLGYASGALLTLVVASYHSTPGEDGFLTWRAMLALPSLPYAGALILCAFCIPESPRYLSVTGQHARAWAVPRWMYETNGGPVPEDFCLAEKVLQRSLKQAGTVEGGDDTPQEASEIHNKPANEAIGFASYTWAKLSNQGILRKCFAISSVWVCLAFASQLMHAWMPYFLRQVSFGFNRKISHHDHLVEVPYAHLAMWQIADGCGIILGSLAPDNFGYLMPLRWAMFASFLAALVSIYPSIYVVFVCGALQQGAQAMCWALIGSMSTLMFPTVIRQSTHSMLRAVENLGMTLGPVVGGLLVERYSKGTQMAITMAGLAYALGFFGTYIIRASDDPASETLQDVFVGDCGDRGDEITAQAGAALPCVTAGLASSLLPQALAPQQALGITAATA
eukprot:CAMPEP_0180616808 /NCGR_PEP_ID=MMETSP1037_2-20121125/32680_1 /TAXON_ID=632150 /ORGANISM="Azadinium spinosum, Strain 3D9" /LENGTH=519 /DNA_ID=CAMNT_0022636677 /DNA_START=147 /DNA_END=1703 /DNA_ORIENTATION=-